MEQRKTFIYIANDIFYYQKNIILSRNSIRVSSINFDLEKTKGLDKFSKQREINNAMKKVVSDNDVIVASSDFTSGDAIITSGGIILGDNLPSYIMSKARTKRANRRMKIASYFAPGSYFGSCTKEYNDNFRLMDEILLNLYKELCTNNLEDDSKADVYLTLLNCLIEAPQPIKSNDYEYNIKKMALEHSKILCKEYNKKFERE